MNPTFAAQLGGIFALLTFLHFVVDWGMQTHHEAMHKATNPWVRARHCGIYTIGLMAPTLLWLSSNLQAWEAILAANILFWSHFFEDTYKLVYLWARYVRQVPGLRLDGVDAFKTEFGKPLSLLLFITIDQLVHLAFLFPLAYFILSPVGQSTP